MTDLRSETSDGVLTLTIDREERRNALNGEVMRGLLAGVREQALADDVRVVVIAGAGEKAFCAGADLAATAPDATPFEVHEGRGSLVELILAMRDCPRPIIGRVQGLALAGGMGVAMGCDFVVASESAEFGMPEVNIGLWPFMISALAARHVSPKRALDLMYTGRRIDAATAYDWGLVTRVVPAADLDGAVAELAAGLAAKSPLILRVGKQAFYAVEDLALEPALAYLQTQLSLLSQTKDAVEGVTAFLQKRPPEWTGR